MTLSTQLDGGFAGEATEGSQALASLITRPGNPSGPYTASPPPGSHQNPLPLHILLGTSGTQQSDLEAVISLHCYTHDAKKNWPSLFIASLQGKEVIFLPQSSAHEPVGLVLGMLCCGLSSSSGCAVPHPSLFF